MLINFLSESETKSQLLSEQIALDRFAVIILGGGEGKRLEPLTKSRCKPAISFGGRYNLIDVPISHAISTGLRKIFVIGQYLATSLQKHLYQTYNTGVIKDQIQMLVPEEREGGKVWYKGTADAIRQNLNHFAQVSADYFLILSGDQLYNINFEEMIRFAIETQAGLVIASQPVNEKNATRMGLLKIEHGGTKIVNFYEKPKEKEILDDFFVDDITLHRLGYDKHNDKHYLGSMGIYLFKRQTLFDLLQSDQRDDFGKHLIQTQMQKGDVHAYLYDGYWEDIGTIESYYHANLALTRHGDDRLRGFQMYDEKNLIYTKTNFLPGAKILGTRVKSSIICEGSIVEADEISHSIIGVRSIIRKGTIITESILMGNEYYEFPALTSEDEPHPIQIGSNCLITKAIIDENVAIGNNVKLVNLKQHTHYDSPAGEVPIVVRDGIIIVPRGTVIPSGFVF